MKHSRKSIERKAHAVPHEVRADSAFFSDELVTLLYDHRVEFTLSVPFEPFVELKGMIERRRRWRSLDADRSFFESHWRPKSWTRSFRLVFIRKRVARQRKGPVQFLSTGRIGMGIALIKAPEEFLRTLNAPSPAA